MIHPLTSEERDALLHFRDRGSAAESRRAQIILLMAESASTQEIVQAVDLSPTQVRYWKREWLAHGTAIFSNIETPHTDPMRRTQTALVAAAVLAGDPQPLTEEETAVQAEYDTEPPEPPAPSPGIDTPRLPLALRDAVGMSPDDPMAEAGRKALHFHFERMLANEPGVRANEDIEFVHDMRVATRRMRSAFRVFGDFFTSKTTKPHRDDLRSVAGALGDVRDLDVFREKTVAYQQDHPDAGFSPLYEEWDGWYEDARERLIKHLDSKSFARFVKRFNSFLTTPGKGALPMDSENPTPNLVRHVAPRMIYERYEQVRAYGPLLDGAPVTTLHALRIDLKRLRYALEFFEEVLGPEGKNVIREVKRLQDHLGDLNDAEVAGSVLRDFILRHNQTFSGIPQFMRPNIADVIAYADARNAEKATLIETFPEAWAAFTRDEVRRDLALAVSVL